MRLPCSLVELVLINLFLSLRNYIPMFVSYNREICFVLSV